MTGISVQDITTDHAEYGARRRDTFRTLVPLRKARRVRLGDLLLLEFENVETLTLQVQEMVYVERLSDPAEVMHEVEAYSRLLPGSHRLVATMFVEIDQLGEVRTTLAELDGIQRSLALRVGNTLVPAVEIPGPDEDPDAPTETVSVHMLAFPLTDATRDAMRDPAVPAAIVVEHPAYSAEAVLDGAIRLALIGDLAL